MKPTTRKPRAKSRPRFSALTVCRLKAIKKAILKYPKLYRQTSTNVPSRSMPNSSCGTAGCLLGWAITLFGPTGEKLNSCDSLTGVSLLGLTETRSRRLFSDWPAPFARKWNDMDECTPEFAKVGAARIDHFLKTGR